MPTKAPRTLPFARRIMRRAVVAPSYLPTYGSPEWAALTNEDDKLAAMAHAAECWRTATAGRITLVDDLSGAA